MVYFLRVQMEAKACFNGLYILVYFICLFQKALKLLASVSVAILFPNHFRFYGNFINQRTYFQATYFLQASVDSGKHELIKMWENGLIKWSLRTPGHPICAMHLPCVVFQCRSCRSSNAHSQIRLTNIRTVKWFPNSAELPYNSKSYGNTVVCYLNEKYLLQTLSIVHTCHRAGAWHIQQIKCWAIEY